MARTTVYQAWDLYLRLAALFELGILLLGGCAVAPAKSPAALDVARVAIVLTDEALATYYAVAPDALEHEDWLVLDKAAIAAARDAQNVCPAISRLVIVARGIGCLACERAIDIAQKELSCQQ